MMMCRVGKAQGTGLWLAGYDNAGHSDFLSRFILYIDTRFITITIRSRTTQRP